jgi:tetratricopeptide (TPR) repeat protein
MAQFAQREARGMSRRRWAVFLVCSMVGRAWADEDPDLLLARGHFRRGQAYYEAGDFTHALAEFRAAGAQKHLNQFSYNAAVCEERLGHVDEAIADYREFLASSIDEHANADVRVRVARLERVRKPLPTRVRYAAPIALTTTAVALAGVGAGLLGWVASDYHPLVDAYRAAPSQALTDRAHTLEGRADASYALFGVAGGLALAGIVTWAIATKRR